MEEGSAKRIEEYEIRVYIRGVKRKDDVADPERTSAPSSNVILRLTNRFLITGRDQSVTRRVWH